jgi:hypothetical protein
LPKDDRSYLLGHDADMTDRYSLAKIDGLRERMERFVSHPEHSGSGQSRALPTVRRGRHASITTTLRIYAHVLPTHGQAAARRLSGVLYGVRDQSVINPKGEGVETITKSGD